VTSGTHLVPTATIRLRRGEESLEDSCPGNGAVDAAMKAIDRILHKRGHLVEYHVAATTKGKDALGEVIIKADFGSGQVLSGKGASTDVVEASARAYLNAVNRMLAIEAAQERAEVVSREEVAQTP
jgi:2-isopropylmalate synthase